MTLFLCSVLVASAADQEVPVARVPTVIESLFDDIYFLSAQVPTRKAVQCGNIALYREEGNGYTCTTPQGSGKYICTSLLGDLLTNGGVTQEEALRQQVERLLACPPKPVADP